MHKNQLFSKDFTLVAIGQVISLFGNQILRYALPLYLLQQTGSSALFGTIMAVSFVPMLLLYPIGGIIADRANKRNIMVVLDFCTAALALVFCLLAGRMDIVPLMAATMVLLYGIQGVYQPAVKASVPVLVAPGRLMQANSVVDLISSVAGMAGPVLGGVFFAAWGLRPILFISIGCFFASAVMELFIRIPFAKQPGGRGLLATATADLKESFGFMLKGQPVLWQASLVYACVGLFLTALMLIALPVLVTQRLGFAPDTATRLYGYAQGAVAAGAIAGGALAGLLAKRLRAKAGPLLLFGCAACMLAAGLGLHALQSPMAAYGMLLAGFAGHTALSTIFQIQIMAYIQIATPARLIGKVISCVICVCMCTSPLGQLLYGFVFEHIGSAVYLPFYAAFAAVAGISFFTRGVFLKLDALATTATENTRESRQTMAHSVV